MLKIAITGNIASGKSQVEAILEDFGFDVIDTDKINKNLLENDLETIEEIKKEFKNKDILDNGEISKVKLANIVFNDNNEKQKLENILHKKILKEVESFCSKTSKNIIFVAVPILFEAKWERHFDKILFVSANEDTRLERLIKRNNLTKKQALSRIKAQDKEENKIAKSDYVIYNNSDLATLKLQTNEFISKLTNQ